MGLDTRLMLYLTGVKPLVHRDWLAAHSRLHGRTRMLFATCEGREWTMDVATNPVLTPRIGYVRSGVLSACADICGATTLTLKIRKVADASLVGTITLSGGSAGWNTRSHFGSATGIPTGQALYVDVECSGSAVGNAFRDLSLFEISHTVTGLTDKQFDVDPDLCVEVTEPGYLVAHGAAADVNALNLSKADRPSSQMLYAQRYGSLYSTSLTSNVLKIDCNIDRFVGRYVHFMCALQCPTDGANTITARADILNFGKTLTDSLTMTATGTTWQYVHTATLFDLSALTNNGDMVGQPGWIELRLKSGNGAIVELKGIRVHIGDTSAAGDYPY